MVKSPKVSVQEPPVARLLDAMTPTELMSFRPLSEVAQIQGVSEDTVQREDKRRVARGKPSRIVDMSERRKGMRLIHALCPDTE
jgi:hypothetical protein